MKSRSRKRILVTGGAGFLGSHLCERLLTEGNEVLCVDYQVSKATTGVFVFMRSGSQDRPQRTYLVSS